MFEKIAVKVEEMHHQLQATGTDSSSGLGKSGLGAISVIGGGKVDKMEDVTNGEARIPHFAQMLGSDAVGSKSL